MTSLAPYRERLQGIMDDLQASEEFESSEPHRATYVCLLVTCGAMDQGHIDELARRCVAFAKDKLDEERLGGADD